VNLQSRREVCSTLSIFTGSSFSAASRSPILCWPLAIWDSVPKELSGLQEHSSATTGGYVTHTGQYGVETLTLPGLEPKTVCSYTMVSKTYSAQTPSTPEESRRIEKEHDEEIELEQNQRQAADNACAPKLAPLGFPSLDDVYKAFNSWGRLQYNVDYTLRIPPDARGPGVAASKICPGICNIRCLIATRAA
jgi:hypothetical protein